MNRIILIELAGQVSKFLGGIMVDYFLYMGSGKKIVLFVECIKALQIWLDRQSDANVAQIKHISYDEAVMLDCEGFKTIGIEGELL